MQAIVPTQHWITTPDGKLFAQSWSPPDEAGEPVVLLHDSLGCVALWRDFPQKLALATRRCVIAYDRLGFGRSDAFPGLLPKTFIADEGRGSFRLVCEQLGLSRVVVFGHSVGGGMAAGCAAAHPETCSALIIESAQAFVEERTLEGIRVAEKQFAEPGQLERLQKYHGDKAHWVLHAWIDTWLGPDYREWTLDSSLFQVHCPVLVLHGDHDEFGSLRHPERIAANAPGPTSLRILEDCGHVPHRERPDEVLAAISGFLRR